MAAQVVARRPDRQAGAPDTGAEHLAAHGLLQQWPSLGGVEDQSVGGRVMRSQCSERMSADAGIATRGRRSLVPSSRLPHQVRSVQPHQFW